MRTQRNILHFVVIAGAAIATLGAPRGVQAQQGSSLIGGLVRDSLTGRPLAGARVELVLAAARESAGYVAEADSNGRFRIDAVTPGRYVIGFAHPRLDSLGLLLAPRDLDVRASSAMNADLAVPSARGLGDVLCGMRGEGTGAIIGRVMDADDGVPVSSGTVLIRWGEIQVDSTGVHRVLRGVRARIGAGGRFAACGIPTDAPVLVQARALTDLRDGSIAGPPAEDSLGKASIIEAASDGIELTLAAGEPVRFRDIFVPSTSLRPATVRDSLAATGGTAARAVVSRVTGRIVGVDGAPLVGARVLARAGQREPREAVSNVDGFYFLDGLVSGTQTLEVIALGYQPSRHAVDLRPTGPLTLDVRLARTVNVLSAVGVYDAPARAGTEFARRQRGGVGVFLTSADIRRRTSTHLANALVGVAGLRVIGISPNGTPLIGGRSNCTPAVFLDGFFLQDGFVDLDRWVRPSEIGGIEVYAEGVPAPPQFLGLTGFNPLPSTRGGGVSLDTTAGGSRTCGVLVAWTKLAIQ
jgi:hypothetical protein